ncbi:ABC transporter substrate-binding protein [Pseudomonas zhanjiangensis]|uniref:ABC transporter substrate-binding protein n=1 Tax=Pseudomonas zhanjiangensis TaxID=3239015 RepID=A0ABV3YTZ4_9PSED
MPGLWIRHWLLVCCLLCGSAAQAATIILSGATDQAAISAFGAALAERRPADKVEFVPLQRLPVPAAIPDTARLILFGSEALDWRLSTHQGPPTLILRVSQEQARQRLGTTRPDNLSLLWSEPAPARQLRLAKLLLPHAKRIGVLHDRHSEFLIDELRPIAAELDLQIIAQDWPDTRDNRPLLSLLGRSDLLLGLNDSDLYNSQTAKSLLLTSYSQQRTLIGPNAGFVRAGSLASSYSDKADWLASLDQLLDQPPENWPSAGYPAYFKVLGNRQVARALAIEMAEDAQLTRQVAEGENP